MYMPLCRECHARETKFHHSEFQGDLENIDVKVENNAFGKGTKSSDSPSNKSEETTASLFDTEGAKSFSEDIEGADEM